MEPLDGLRALHAEIDELVSQLEHFHSQRLQCHRGCSACCVDELTVFQVEAERIRAEQASVLSSQEPHPAGACAFLDAEGACRIYESRPYVCRTQGLPIRWVEEADDGAAFEYRDICELNTDGPLITDLKPGQCWTIGPAEAKLFALESERVAADPAGDGQPKRVALRSLFVG